MREDAGYIEQIDEFNKDADAIKRWFHVFLIHKEKGGGFLLAACLPGVVLSLLLLLIFSDLNRP